MVCYPGPISGQKYSTVYGNRMNSEWGPHHVMQYWRAVCEDCGAELAVAYMVSHLHTYNGRSGQARPLPLTLLLTTPTE